MSRIFITGDIHGTIDVNRFSSSSFVEGKELTRDDYVIIVGDFGLLWANAKDDLYWLKWLNEKPWTTLWIDGNHENFNLLYEYPTEDWNGGKVRRIRENILHLGRGEMFNLHGKKFFTFGGASSIDKEHRTENISWWPQEIPTVTEFEHGMKTLDEHNWKCDYVLTHTCPTSALHYLTQKFGFELKLLDAVNVYLETLMNKGLVDYQTWFFGHFHDNVKLPQRQVLLYDQIIELPKG
jgi:hypothetical protein